MKGNGATRPLWVIARQDNDRMYVLTIYHDKSGEALPIFSFEEEAEMFLQLETPGTCWRARATTPGEMVSLLYGPCADVESVALDPLPVVVDGEIIADLTGRGKDRFIWNLLDRHRGRKKPVPKILESTDPSTLLGEDWARDAKKERAEEARRRIPETAGEVADGKDESPVQDYTVLDFNYLDEPHSLSEASRNGELGRT